MQLIKTVFLFFFVLLLSAGCNDDDGMGLTGDDDEQPIENSDFETVTFEESFEDFANPERGFYRYSETRSGNYSPLSVTQMRNYRTLYSLSSGSSYETYKTLVFRYFVMEDFTGGPISEDYLAAVQSDFDAAREAGVKLIPRFCYTTTATAGACPEGFICPPYGDAPKDVVLGHIEQLAPVLNQNTDVILTVQMGFIGTWGENYYTDHFGDASSNGPIQKVLDENWTDRTDVLQSMLDNFANELTVQVRYPQIKQRTVYGISALTNVAALTAEEAFTDSDKARIGHHNDCLFASADDFGTYVDYGTTDTDRRTDLPNLKAYFTEDGKYTYVGGETCSDGYSPQNDCTPEGTAETQLRTLHYTYLNADYNNQVNNDWQTGGCMEGIKLNLGYRHVLRSGMFEKQLSEDRVFNFELGIENVGYATVMSDRPVYLILKNTDTGAEIRHEPDTDIRRWERTVSLREEINISGDTAPGTYEVCLFFPDGHASLSERPEYAIRLGNTTEWDAETGYNHLGITVTL